jgi:branched-chain amino acid transport system ATP-binding protein
LLDIAQLCVSYGKVDVLHDVSMNVGRNECVALLGPNNAGKTTLLRAISGLVPARAGSIKFAGADIGDLRSNQIVAQGVIQIPEGRHIFADLSVEENLLVGGARLKPHARRLRLDELLSTLPLLGELRSRRAGTLSGGQQQLVVISRALMAEPRLLLIDEPTLGLSPVAIDEVFTTLRDVHGTGTTILLSEQNAELSLELCSRGYVMAGGRIVLEGDSAQLKEAALGKVYLT